MNKLIIYGIIGGLAYYFLLRPKAVIPPTAPQAQLTVDPNPEQMQTSPGMQGVSMYNEDVYPIGIFTQ